MAMASPNNKMGRNVNKSKCGSMKLQLRRDLAKSPSWPWKGYVRAPPKELLRLRSLIARGRAREKRRLRAKTPPEIANLFAPTFPNELFWKVATYWNPRYEEIVVNPHNN